VKGEGVLVTGVDPDSRAGRAGLAVGDVIYKINYSTVSGGAAGLARQLEGISKGQWVWLQVRRGQRALLVRFLR
jgi:S1-C subfamily serine protease